MTYDTRMPIPPIQFMGLNTHVSELFIEDYSSPDLNNVDLHPAGSIKKRRGMDVLRSGIALEAPAAVTGSGAMQALFHLRRESDSRDLLVACRGDIISMYDLNATTGWLSSNVIRSVYSKTFSAAIGPFNDERATSGDATDDIYRGESLYMVDGKSHPLIIHDNDFTPEASISVDTVVPVSVGAYYPVKFGVLAGHNLADGDLVEFTGTPGEPWYDRLAGLVWTVGTDGNFNFYISTRELDVWREPSLGAWPGDLSWTGSVRRIGGVRGWPAGKYHSPDPSFRSFRGYPPRWVDYQDEQTFDFFPYSDNHDLPTGIEIVGSALSLRSYAYGFEFDPDRIDVGELGAPYNFMKREVAAATEADALSQPGVDGGYFYCRRGDGDRVIAVREFRGYVIVFKKLTTTIYVGDFGYDMRRVQTFDVGAVSNESVIVTGNDIFFWSQDGPRNFSVTDRFGDLIAGSISENVIEVVKTVVGTAQSKISGYHDRLNKRIVWDCAINGEADNNACLIYYYPDMYDPRGRWSKYTGYLCEQVKVLSSRMVVTGQERQFGGSQDGYVYELNVGASDDRDWSTYPATDYEDLPLTPIQSHYVTRWFTFGQADVVKRAIDAFIALSEEGFGELEIYQGVDYLSEWHQINDVVGASGDSPGYWNYLKWNYPNTDPAYPAAGHDTTLLVGSTPADPDLFYWDTTGRAYVQFRLKDLAHIYRFKFSDEGVLPYGVGGLVVDARAKGKRS